jgi:hypothetical protein
MLFLLSYPMSIVLFSLKLICHKSEKCKTITAKRNPEGSSKHAKKRPHELRINDDDLLNRDAASFHKFAASSVLSGAKYKKLRATLATPHPSLYRAAQPRFAGRGPFFAQTRPRIGPAARIAVAGTPFCSP